MQIIELRRFQKLITEEPDRAYRIHRGSIRVFLQPVYNGKLQRQMFWGEYQEEDEIPSLNHREMSGNVDKWYYFVITALEETRLEMLDHCQWETGWEKELLVQYENAWEESASRVHRVKDKIPHSQNAEYQAASSLCQMQKIPIASYDKIRKAIGEEPEMDDIARISGFICRQVVLEKGWQHRLSEPVLCHLNQEWCIGIPGKYGKIHFLFPSDGKVRKVHDEEFEKMDATAWFFHRSFQNERVNIKDIIQLTAEVFSVWEIFFLLVCMFLITWIGIRMAYLSQMIYDVLIPLGDQSMIGGIAGIFLACVAANLCFTSAKNLISYRMDSRVRYTLQAAVYERVFHLPEKFFRNRDSAEQAYRIQLLTSSYMRLYTNIIQILLQGGFSLAYLWKMHSYSSVLSHIATWFLVLNVLITILIGWLDRISQRNKSCSIGRFRSFLYQTLSGIEVIRTFGAEDDILQTHMKQIERVGIADKKSADNRRFSAMLGTISNALAIIILYNAYATTSTGITIGAFMGFITLFLSFSATMCMVAQNSMDIISMMPMIKDSSIFFREIPERSGKGEIPEKLEGDIQLSHVSFAYGRNQKNVLQDISIHIQPGEYVGIVGETGCGKSTLLRLMLGFEKPISGQIYYDGITTERYSLPELRRKVGVVLQEGSLFLGSIYRNIKIANPKATPEQVRRAVEDAGLAEVVERMPMGLNTFVSEQGRTLSGGEKQRILIARAIVGSPKIIFFDEATSSLDNISQSHISESLEKYQATRVVIAHRLSTIVHCDRIIVLDQGRIKEIGTYQELMEKRGKFFELTQKQIIES